MTPGGSARRRFLHLLAATVLVQVAVGGDAPAADLLPSWNDGLAKRSIVDFVRRVSDPASPDHVAPAERIAVFDNDGTLWPEYPLPCQERGR